MPKSSRNKVNEDKGRLIKLLEENPKLSANEISDKLGFSRQKAWRLVKDLEKSGKIWGYTAVFDSSVDNYNIYFALIKQNLPYLDCSERIIKNIRSKNSEKLGIKLIGLYYTTGSYDGICIFAAKNIIEAKKYLGYMMKEYSEYLTKVDLVENIFPIIHSSKINPKLNKLRDFSIE
jgi:DNA-binding Lrp family transcriptional regulator